MGDKKELMTIGEIAKAMGLTRRIIINYEDRGLITSDLREGEGYRYYTVDSLTRIRTIRLFQNMGLTLDEIRAYFDDSSDLSPMLSRLEMLRDELNLNIEKLRERIKSTGENEIHTITLPRQTVYRQTFLSATVAEKTARLRETTLLAMKKYGTDTSRRLFFVEYPLDAPDSVSYCICVPEGSGGEYIEILPETQALCIYYHGAYEQLPAVRERILDAARERRLTLSGVCRHIYLEGPPQHKDAEKFITQVAVPVIERRRNPF